MNEKEILVSLGDKNVKEIGEAIGNKTCNKILDLLVNGEMSTMDMAKKMKLPPTTVDYAVKKLLKTGLVSKGGNWWSVKGRKINTYKISNRRIIISPKRTVGRVFGLALGLTGLAGITLRQIFKDRAQVYSVANLAVRQESALFAADTAEAVGKSMPLVDGGANAIAPSTAGFFEALSPWSWFLFGAWFAILIFFIVTIWTERRGKK